MPRKTPKTDPASSPLALGWRSGEDDRVPEEGVDAKPPTEPAQRDATQRKPRRPRTEPTPTQRALGLLVRREHSRRELTRKLTARGVERDDAVAAVDKLEAAGWQDDGRFAESLDRSRASTGNGPVRIRAELGMHGLDREAAAAAMDAVEMDWTDLARDLVRRRFGEDLAEDRDRQRKAADWLLRRGFTGAQVRAATRFDPDD
jgi:regulatory protein